MFYGVRITYGVDNWQVFQRGEDGRATACVGGVWRLEEGAIKVGVASVMPLLRLMREDDNSIIWNWTAADEVSGDQWQKTITLPSGGLYRLETSLEAVSAKTGDKWMFRGDIRTHIGAGDVFIIAGQSNAAGYGRGAAFDPPDMMVHVKRNSGHWDMATHPLNDATDAYDCPNAPMGLTGSSPYISFGRRHASFSRCPVGLIPAAQGGVPISRFEGDLFRNMINKATFAGGVAGVLWYQGCTDACMDEGRGYFSKFRALVERARRELKREVPFYTFQLNGYLADKNDAPWGEIKDAQRRAANEIPGVYVLPTLRAQFSDDIHNSSDSNVRLGEELANLIDLGVGAPNIISARARGCEITLEFERATGFTVFNQSRFDYAFRVEDEAGAIGVTGVAARGNAIVLSLERESGGDANVSYEFEAAPPSDAIVDSQTYLPIIAFYKYPVMEEN